jgi:1-phosphatidylinositol-3-phosphate 5-kinase
VFTQFSWRLENSFLMDEFALPPSPPTDSFLEEPATSDSSQHDSAIVLSNRELLHGSCEVGAEEPQVHRMNDGNVTSGTCDVAAAGESAQQGDMRSFSRSSSVQFNENVQSDNSSISSRKQCICCDKAEHVSPSCADCNNIMSSGSRKQTVVRESRNSSAGEGHVCEPLRELTQAEEAQTNCDSGKTQATHSGSKEKSLSEEKRTNVESVSDFSDPLHLYLNLDDEVFSTGSGQLSVAELPLTNRFRKALDDTILCSSPYLQVMLLS